MKRAASGIVPLLALDRAAAKPLYRQLYEGFREAILAGRLGAGQRLPSTRGLADELQVSRLPVLTAFEQLLAEGYFESRAGAGTFVARSLADAAAGVRTPCRRPARSGTSGRRRQPRPAARETRAVAPGDRRVPRQPDRRRSVSRSRSGRAWSPATGGTRVASQMLYGDPMGDLPLPRDAGRLSADLPRRALRGRSRSW